MRPSADLDLDGMLAQCASEPVHVPDAIQPAGCLISADTTLTRILQVSANVQGFLGISATDALAASPRDLLGTRLLARIRRAFRERDAGQSRSRCGACRTGRAPICA